MTRQVNGKIVLRGQQQWGLPGNLLTLVEEEGEEKGDESKEVGEEVGVGVFVEVLLGI